MNELELKTIEVKLNLLTILDQNNMVSLREKKYQLREMATSLGINTVDEDYAMRITL